MAIICCRVGVSGDVVSDWLWAEGGLDFPPCGSLSSSSSPRESSSPPCLPQYAPFAVGAKNLANSEIIFGFPLCPACLFLLLYFSHTPRPADIQDKSQRIFAKMPLKQPTIAKQVFRNWVRKIGQFSDFVLSRPLFPHSQFDVVVQRENWAIWKRSKI